MLLDVHLATLYGVEAGALTLTEWHNLKSQIVISSSHGGRRSPPTVFEAIRQLMAPRPNSGRKIGFKEPRRHRTTIDVKTGA